MKKLLLLIFLSGCFVPACKKENPTNPSSAATHTIEYEVNGFLNMEITYDGVTYHAGNTSSWDHTFSASTGKALSLSAYNSSGTQTIEVSIYQDGAKTKTANGYGTQSVTDVVK